MYTLTHTNTHTHTYIYIYINIYIIYNPISLSCHEQVSLLGYV